MTTPRQSRGNANWAEKKVFISSSDHRITGLIPMPPRLKVHDLRTKNGGDRLIKRSYPAHSKDYRNLFCAKHSKICGQWKVCSIGLSDCWLYSLGLGPRRWRNSLIWAILGHRQTHERRGELFESPGIFPSGVRDVAFLQPHCNRRSQGCCTCMDTEFSNRQGANNPWRTPQEETILGRNPTIGSRSKTRG